MMCRGQSTASQRSDRSGTPAMASFPTSASPGGRAQHSGAGVGGGMVARQLAGELREVPLRSRDLHAQVNPNPKTHPSPTLHYRKTPLGSACSGAFAGGFSVVLFQVRVSYG